MEAGSGNGREASSCHVLEKELGWSGICVEPNDAFFEADPQQARVRHTAPSLIDYAAFDIEGSEWDVLENFSFRQYTFLALSLECDGVIWAPVSKLLGGNGYREVSNPFNRHQPWERYWLHEQVAATGNLS